jgi:hypothetical protein
MLLSSLDSRLADYFVNSVGQLAGMLIEADAKPLIWPITRP